MALIFLRKTALPGRENGDILWETDNTSGTLWEYPVIANIDDDASVEIIVSAPGSSGQRRPGGIRVFEDPKNLWVTSRRVWNQYSYYPELIGDDLKVVTKPDTPKSGFRVNKQGSLMKEGKILLSDLTAHAPLFGDDAESDAPETTLSVYVVNRGEAAVSGPVKFDLRYAVDRTLLGSVRPNVAVGKGEGQLVSIPVTEMALDASEKLLLEINVDGEEGLLARECDANNNRLEFKLIDIQRAVEVEGASEG